ncbi:MAG: hypothetical protein K0R73_93 [Candidatus Midichloriaceae bacterium]|jgi:hypothetical protein|nr:hypothetical protein [Candidatus Midichloriaceae bacterium]
MVALSTLFTDYLKPGARKALVAAWHLAIWNKPATAILVAYSFSPTVRNGINVLGYGAFKLIASGPARLIIMLGGVGASGVLYKSLRANVKAEDSSIWREILLVSGIFFSWQIYDLGVFRLFANNRLTTMATTSIGDNVHNYATNQLPLIEWGAWIVMYFAREEAKKATESKELYWFEKANLGEVELFKMPEVKWGEVIQKFQELYNQPTKEALYNICSLLGNRTFGAQAGVFILCALSGNTGKGIMLASSVSGLGSVPNLLWTSTQFMGLLHTPLNFPTLSNYEITPITYAAGLAYSRGGPVFGTLGSVILFAAKLTSASYLPYVGVAISGVSMAISVGTFIHSYCAANKQPNPAPDPNPGLVP